jgi:hypothetical protein
VVKIISQTIVNFVTPKAGAKHELLLKKTASEVSLLNTQVRLQEQNSVTKIISQTCMNFATPKSGAKHKITEAGLLYKR